MHCSSYSPRAFRNRSARYLGVLVAAALVATLGLPSAVQAQTPDPPTVTYTDDDFTVMTGHGVLTDTHSHWVLEHDSPSASSAQVVVPKIERW